ncbi:glutathione reductase (NADPH) [Carnobacterium iners]|uniref:Glutathione reductase (NADPH) n=1 Tax=Carnobacterium iners TaxID=1073423 RepID=A0A1X7N3L8_9LACT|nr:NAD(P)/FAD-dependent oxidoreductase [Carnobacterium iners]SEK61763.1 glutathione reductase (NADPH) [Carnobacterium iners]SMH31978.1 glutathione reductase (NADPH) [Carnobacterium iners]
MEKNFDVIVIGSGVGGMAVAKGLAARKKIAIVENDLWGGTCPNRGCDPKKVLYSVVEAKDAVTQLTGKGFSVTPQVHWPELMSFKESIINPMSKGLKKSMDSSGIETIAGKATFINKQTIQVNEDTLTADKIIIATGARPAILSIKGKEHLLTSTDFLSLSEMPKKVTFIGGGYIAFELATIANAAGAEVHIIHHNKRPLKEFESELVNEIVHQLESKGVIFHFDTDTTKIEKSGESFILQAENNFTLATDLVFCATGRIPNIEELNLDKAEVAYDKKGIQTNDYLQTSNENIFACGDVLSKSAGKLTPVASFEGAYLTNYLTGKTTEKINYPYIPTVIYSNPKVAQIGITTEQASKQEEKYTVSSIDATSWFSYHRTNEPVSKIKIVTNRETGLVAGATCLNGKADELINYISLLMDQKMTKKETEQLIMAYPTVASDLSSIYK